MRSDADQFKTRNEAVARQPRFVVQIIFDASSPSFTSHSGIANVPGTAIEAVIVSISSTSQEVKPEDGRSTIGSLTVELAENDDGDITEELRQQLLDYDQGARDRPLKVYVGYTDDFDDFVLVSTLRVDGVKYAKSKYTISARDLTRELRKKICQPKVTRLTASIDEDDTTLTVEDTTDFSMIPHGASFLEAPSSTVGYVRIKKTGEIIRYTGKSSTTFTGCTRGRFNTKAQAVEWSGSDSRDRWPEVEEFIYLELPGPLMALALQTGILSTTTPTVVLPDHWHCGLAWGDDYRQGSWTGIGEDLYDPADLTLGFPIRFLGLSDEDGKALIERDVMQLIGCYISTAPNGKLRLNRVNRVIAENGYARKLTPANVIKHGDLEYDHGALLNSFRVDYEWNGEDYTRSVLIIDQPSVDKHGIGEQRTLKFKGLHTARHTERAIKDRLGVLRDRYAEPPLRLSVTLPGKFNALEIGDTVRVALPSLLDHTRDDASLDRCFEVQRVQVNWITGAVDLRLFASARLQETEPDSDATAPIDDDWYTAAGTNATSLTGYSAGHLTANVTHSGHATNVRDATSILYHAGDLTIDSGVTLTINDHVQLRVRGFLQINGKIDGAGRGPSGATDPDSVGATSTAWSTAGTAGYLGPTRAGDGVWIWQEGSAADYLANTEGALTEGRVTAAGPAALETTAAGNLTGLPGLLRGSSGGSGGQVTYGGSIPHGTVRAKGGAGGDGGAGLLIVCRGLGFGPSGEIDLSGDDGSAGSKGLTSAGNVYDLPTDGNPWLRDYPAQAGGGAGGYPGVLHVVLDGFDIPVPTIDATTFKANRGATLIRGESAVGYEEVGSWSRLQWSEGLPERGIDQSPILYATGRNEDWQGDRENIWAAAHVIQFAPDAPAPQEDVVPRPIWATTATTTGIGYVSLNWKPTAQEVKYVEVWASTTNDRSFAEEIARVRSDHYNHHLPTGGVRWYWLRARAFDGRLSEWSPTGSTSGQKGRAMDAGTEIILTSTRSRTWSGDGSTSPLTWTPATTTTDLICQVRQLGEVIATERIRVTRSLTGTLTWAYVTNHADITTTASATPSTTIDFEFTHTPTGIKAFDTVFATVTREPGEPGEPGAPGSSKLLGVKANYSTFSTATDGYMYLHGYDENGDAADVDGEVFIGNDLVTVPKGSIRTSQTRTVEGWIVFDPSAASFTYQGGSDLHYAAAKKTRDGDYYDLAGYSPQGWGAFTGTNDYVIGAYRRAGTSLTFATAYPAAVPWANVPVERAHVVEPGDLTAGSIEDAAAFAASIQPVEIVNGLPAAAGWGGSVTVFDTVTLQLYRWNGSSSPIAWDKVVAGDIAANTITAGMITAGAIGATALAADIVLATIFRTASSGQRVEIEGGHDFPLWVGGGTKGASSPSPGGSAKLWYDTVLQRLGVRGQIKVESDQGQPIIVEATSNQACSLSTVVETNGAEVTLTLATTGWTTVCNLPAIFHPDRVGSGDGDAYRRLQHSKQPFTLVLWLTADSAVAGAARTVAADIEYRFNGSGSWYIIGGGAPGGITVTTSDYGGSHRVIVYSCYVDNGGFTDYVSFRVRAAISAGADNDTTAQATMVALIPNTGLANQINYPLT